MKGLRYARGGRWGGAALACAVLAAWVVPGSFAKTEPEAVEITVTMACASDEQEPVFVAHGAIVDSGEVEFAFLGPDAGQYGLTGHTLKTEAVLTGEDGTLTLRWDVVFKVTDVPNVVDEFGQWHIVDGTGAYAGLEGAGRSSGFCIFGGGPNSEIQILEGKVH